MGGKPQYSQTLQVRVTPRASSERIVVEKQASGDPLYRIYVTIVPEDGKANKAVIKLLAKYLGVSKSSLEIIRGETSRDKVVGVV